MTEKKQLTIIWVSAVVLLILLVIVTIVVNSGKNTEPVKYLANSGMNDILKTDKVYAQQDESIQSLPKEKLKLYKIIIISNPSEFEDLASDVNIFIDDKKCYENICTWWGEKKEESPDGLNSDYLSFDIGYQKINMSYEKGIPLQNFGLDLETIKSDPSLLPKRILNKYLGINTEYSFAFSSKFMTQDIYTFNRLVDGKKLFMLSSSDYSDFVSLEGDKVVSFSLHIFSYNQDRSFYQVQVDKEMIDDILVSGSDKITFVTQTYDKIGEQETPVIGDSYEQIPIDVPVPSVCDLNGYEIGYYLNTSSTEKTLVPIYRGTCTGNSKYEGEEYTVNGLIMFELF